MTCPICGSPAADDDTFCSQCGTKLASAETKPSETSSLPAKPEPKPRTVIDRLPNAAENVVWPVAIGIAWVATFQIAASIFGGPAGLMLSSLFGLLATPLHLVLWWALWNGLRRIGSPAAKHALVFALIWTMATPVSLLSASCLYTLMGVDSATARGVLNPVSISMGLLGGLSFGSLVWFTVSVGKHHSGKLLRFSKFIWLAVAVSLIAMGVVFFSGMSLASLLCPPTVAVVILSFLIADILGALPPEGKKSTGVAKVAIWFAPAFAASLAVCIFAMIKIPADIHEPLNESLSAIRSAATGIPRESKTLSVRPSLQPSGGSPARTRKLERLLAFFDNQPDAVLDATIESFELSIQRGRKSLDPLARQQAIELVPRILKDSGIDAKCRDVKNLRSQGDHQWTATAIVWTEEGGEEEVPVSMEYKKDADMFYVTILPSEDSATENESEEDDSSETEGEPENEDLPAGIVDLDNDAVSSGASSSTVPGNSRTSCSRGTDKTRIVNNGRKLALAVISANIEREANALREIWPRYGKGMTKAKDFFDPLFKRGLLDGVNPDSAKGWSVFVCKGVSFPLLPLLVSSNVVKSDEADSSAVSIVDGRLSLNASNVTFGKEIVVITRGGEVLTGQSAVGCLFAGMSNPWQLLWAE